MNEIYFTIYSNSKEYGQNQIESMFRCIANFAKDKIDSEMSVILERNKGLDISYFIESKVKVYKPMKKPFQFILKPTLVNYSVKNYCPHFKNVIFK